MQMPRRSKTCLASLSDYITAPTAYPHLLTIFQGLLSHPNWEITTGTHQHDVGDMYLALTLDNSPLLGETTGPHMTLDHVDFFDDNSPFVGLDAEDFATLASVFTSNDLDKIILADMARTGNPLLHG
jgi:hypothetical protein